MISTLNSGKVFNPICKVNFAGFVSDTYTLQRNGWQICAQQDMRMDGIRLSMKHEAAHLYAMTNFVAAQTIVQAGRNPDFWSNIIFHVECIASDMKFHIQTDRNMSNWAAIDARPEYSPNFEIKHIEDLVPFRAISDTAPEIVLTPASVDELLALALKMQDPKQKEIREKARKEQWKLRNDGRVDDTNSAKDIKAQIVTLVG